MALIKNGTAPAAETKTEAKTETAAAAAAETKPAATEAVQEQVPQEQVQQEQVQEPVQEKALAPRAAAGAVANSGGEKFFLADPEILEIVQDVEYGTFTQVVATNNMFKLAQLNSTMGTEFTFQAIAEKAKKVCSPNSNEDEAKEFFAAAYDGELTSRGITIEEALADAKAAGYLKADLKDYTDLFVLVLDCPAKPEYNGEIVALQLAPMSRAAWLSFKMSLQIKLRLGAVKFENDAPPIKATAVAAASKSNKDYTKYGFSLA